MLVIFQKQPCPTAATIRPVCGLSFPDYWRPAVQSSHLDKHRPLLILFWVEHVCLKDFSQVFLSAFPADSRWCLEDFPHLLWGYCAMIGRLLHRYWHFCQSIASKVSLLCQMRQKLSCCFLMLIDFKYICICIWENKYIEEQLLLHQFLISMPIKLPTIASLASEEMNFWLWLLFRNTTYTSARSASSGSSLVGVVLNTSLISISAFLETFERRESARIAILRNCCTIKYY